ncbi:uncharacterized protein BDR25DRAFT_361713 [Lindgomyces ingoldianus]|uniref:Uncharacterized protein n=1 Tax=Lindgomyces ingoldianus TaxID=673940 RepID=A0ACB6QC64_9PLEO|nr:uncharacterized protein BDR25DRAFT_361713 [Lindgomyces ingoldianus]KAF2464198.1 hypothetical protein BDR25DRAFT_361713 [Lindgomyces ingoldianus]
MSPRFFSSTGFLLRFVTRRISYPQHATRRPRGLIDQVIGAVVQNTPDRKFPVNPIQNVKENGHPVIIRLIFSCAMVFNYHDRGKAVQLKAVDEIGGAREAFCESVAEKGSSMGTYRFVSRWRLELSSSVLLLRCWLLLGLVSASYERKIDEESWKRKDNMPKRKLNDNKVELEDQTIESVRTLPETLAIWPVR